MSESLSDKKNSFKVQIRRKRVQDKISHLRATLITQLGQKNQEEYSDSKISSLIQNCLKSKQALISNINKVKQASFHINQQNSQYFVAIVNDLCYIMGNIDEIKQIQSTQGKNVLYNDIIVILINISSNQAYQWPIGDYLPIIKNLLNKERQINTLWLLSNILYQRNQGNDNTSKFLTQLLVKYDSIAYCEQRLDKKFKDQKDILVFTCYVCSFLSNSIYLTLAEHKKVLGILQKLADLNLENIDFFIFDSMIDHAPNLTALNYQLLYSDIISKFRESYLKKKKTKMVLKFLQFIKTYILCQINQSLKEFQTKESSNIQSKIAKSNYKRISLIILPNLNICLENRSPDVKALLLQICCILLQFYFPFIDLQNQQIFINLAGNLKKDSKTILSKYSNKGLYWQIKLISILLRKIKQFKISKQIISQFISANQILDAIASLLKEKTQSMEIIQQIVNFILSLVTQYDILSQIKNQYQSNQIFLKQISNNLEIILNNHLIHDETLFNKIQNVLQILEEKS